MGFFGHINLGKIKINKYVKFEKCDSNIHWILIVIKNIFYSIIQHLKNILNNNIIMWVPHSIWKIIILSKYSWRVKENISEKILCKYLWWLK